MSEQAIKVNESERRGFFARIALFVRQVISELKHVVTPSRQELIKYTWIVLGFVAVMMLLVYVLDLLFSTFAFRLFGG